MDKQAALACLQGALGDDSAGFRDGQWEAIDHVVNSRGKLLVVQRTGWGKSAVYFVATRLLRDQGMGPTIVVSPLLALMRNQVDAARRLQLNPVTINSTNQERWDELIRGILQDEYDVIFISPERLSNEFFAEEVLAPIAGRLGMLVIDEAHCISDWGHDFRPDYRRLVNVLRYVPPQTPVLGTTATANDRVVNDIRSQLGDVEIQRGPLTRESLALENVELKDQASRMAWLVDFIGKQDGTGIVYVLTKRTAESVANWLKQNGISAEPYYSGVTLPTHPESNMCRDYLEKKLLTNEVKVLVATVALGMGYDKPDLSYVVHFQTPGSIVGYYQQVGRAGRGISEATGVLMNGQEDAEIHEYFRRSAFPDKQTVNKLLNQLGRGDGYSVRELEGYFNMSQTKLNGILKFLSVENPSPVTKQKSKWKRTPVAYELDTQRIDRLTGQREIEWQEIKDYVATDGCLMAFLQQALDDPQPKVCGKCANCLGRPVVDVELDAVLLQSAQRFLRQAETVLTLPKQSPKGAFVEYEIPYNIPQHQRALEGRVLSRWGDAGWGTLVKEGVYAGGFDDALVEATAELYQKRWDKVVEPLWVTCVPSMRSGDLVPSFAMKLAKRLGLPFASVIRQVKDHQPQRDQVNRFYRCQNLDGVFEVDSELPGGPVLLVDDLINSGWTLAVTSLLLRRKGSGDVLPLALSSVGLG
ncbi:MAG: ATP-dependent DNA helicase RecG [Rhodopirellula sp.]|nr:ATP-dependent DNA helicase RecG [Rhodopirellula sp.]|tara:strand:+ start:8744 stop:10837 length:2094 start_codon:yes stop_codon:yes gene_type:complete